MKKSNFVMLLVAMVAYLPLHANNPSPAKLLARTHLIQAKTIKVTLANLQKNVTKMEITNKKGDTVYFKEFIRNHNGYSKTLNLKKLENGTYLIAIKNQGKVLKQVIRIRGDHVFFSKFS